MAYKIIWSPKAEETFEKVIEYLKENWTDKQIKNFVSETERVINLIAKNPYLFRASEKESIFEAIITKHNLLLYQLNDETKEVELLAVFDTRQHPKKKFL